MNNRIRLCLLASFAIIAGCSDGNNDNNNKTCEEDGSCITTCTTGQVRCDSGMKQTCDANGIWQNTPCANSMICVETSGVVDCKTQENPTTCTNGATRCNESVLEKCDGTNWNVETCDGTCVEASGVAYCQSNAENACTAGMTRCNESVLEKCDGTNWNVETCDGTCVEASGVAYCQSNAENACEAGKSRCTNDNKLEKCDGTQWNAEPCNGTCVESNGTAVCNQNAAECSKGQTKCEDNGSTAVLWTCSEDLQWVKNECPASDIEGARLTCKNADSCSTYLCGEGMVFNSETKNCQSLNHSNDCTSGRTYCNGKTGYLYECLSTGNQAATAATDCAKDGKICVKLSDDEARCEIEECKANFCEGETLVFCTDNHKIDPEKIDCTASGRICDLNEEGIAECMYPECLEDGEIQCVEDDETHTKYQQCANQRFGEAKTCANGSKCETIDKVDYCAECHAGEEKCEEIDGKATHFTCSAQYAWEKSACPETKPVCDEDHKTCTEQQDECGNDNHVGAGEDCDGTNMGKAADKTGDEACKLATGDTKATGTLACYPKTAEKACHFDTTNCKFCGNNAIDAEIGETCDGTAEITKTCAELVPNTEGKVKCGADCQYDTSECYLNYTKITEIYKDFDHYIKLNSSTSCTTQSNAPKASVNVTGVVTAIHPNKTGFYIQACDKDDTRGIYVYSEYSVDLPKDLAVGNVYTIKGGLVGSYHCNLQIKKGEGWEFTTPNKLCNADPQDVKLSDILNGPKGDFFGSLVALKGEKTIDFRDTATTADNPELNIPGGEKGWRIGKPGINKEITISSYLTTIAENALEASTKYNVTGIILANENHMVIAPRAKDDITLNTCKASCDENKIFACNGDNVEETAISCAKYLDFDEVNGKAVCSELKDDCQIECDPANVLVDNKCKPGYIETFNYTGETTLSKTGKDVPYETGSFTSEATGLTWNYENAHNALCSNAPIDGNGIMFKGNGKLTSTIPNGIATITLQANKATSGNGERSLKVEAQSVANASKKVTCKSMDFIYDGILNLSECEVKIPGEVTLTVTTSGDQINVDNIMWLSYTE